MLSPSLTIKNVIVAIQLLYIANNNNKNRNDSTSSAVQKSREMKLKAH
jgi:hypothetical protein